MIEDAIELLRKVNTHRPSADKLAEVYRQRTNIDSAVLEDVSGRGEIVLFRDVWFRLAREIWKSKTLDSACLLTSSQIAASIAILRLSYGASKHAKFMIEGRSGVGKTTYALLCTYGAYRILGLDEETAWRLTSSLWIMSAELFADLMYHVVQEGLYIPVIILDEAGLTFSKYWMWMGKKFRKAFASLLEIFDLVKDYIGTIFFTSPTQENIAKRLRDICDYVVRGDEFSEIAEGRDGKIVFRSYSVFIVLRRQLFYYQTYSLPHRDIIKKAKLDYAVHSIDVMPGTIKIPKRLWTQHIRERRRYILTRLEEFLHLIRELYQEEEEELEEREETWERKGKRRRT